MPLTPGGDKMVTHKRVSSLKLETALKQSSSIVTPSTFSTNKIPRPPHHKRCKSLETRFKIETKEDRNEITQVDETLPLFQRKKEYGDDVKPSYSPTGYYTEARYPPFCVEDGTGSVIISSRKPEYELDEDAKTTLTLGVQTTLTSGRQKKSTMKHLESFDYDYFESRVNQQHEVEQTSEKIRDLDMGRWVMTFMIGAATALVACFIEKFVEVFTNFRNYVLQTFVDLEVGSKIGFGGAFTAYALVSGVFVMLAGYCVFVAPVSGGSGIPEIKATLNGIKIHRVVRLETLICKVLGVLFSVSGGLPVGKEGPMVHSGAVVGAQLSQGKWSIFGCDISLSSIHGFRNDKEKRDFISCGAAAGVAAAFGAPIGGVLFVLEEGASFWHQNLTWRSYFCAMVSAFTLHFFASFSKDSVEWGMMGTQGGTFSFGKFEGSKKYAAWEVVIFIMMGVMGGLFGALFNAANMKLTKFRMRYITNRWLKLFEAIFVAVCMAAVTFWGSYFFGTCFRREGPFQEELVQFYCDSPEEYNDLASLFTVGYGTSIRQLLHFTTDGSFTLTSLIVFFIPFYIMACWTYGIAVPSGVFVPSLLSGAAFGRLCVYFMHWLNVPTTAPDGMMALIGAASLLGGMARMTISLTVILLECTGVIEWGLPVMVTLMASRWVGNSFNEGLYDIHIHLKKLPFLEFDPPHFSKHMRAQNIMCANPITMDHIIRVGQVYDILKSFPHSAFPVVEPARGDDDPKFAGVILRKQLCVLLQKKDFFVDRPAPYVRKPPVGETTVLYNKQYALSYKDIESAYPRFPEIHEIKLSSFERDLWMDLTPYMNPAPFTVQEQAVVPRVYRLFRSMGLRHLIVLNHDNLVCGIISRKDLTPDHLKECLEDLSEDDKTEAQGYFTRSGHFHPDCPMVSEKEPYSLQLIGGPTQQFQECVTRRERSYTDYSELTEMTSSS